MRNSLEDLEADLRAKRALKGRTSVLDDMTAEQVVIGVFITLTMSPNSRGFSWFKCMYLARFGLQLSSKSYAQVDYSSG